MGLFLTQQMEPNFFNELVLNSDRRVALPIAVYPGIALTGARVLDAVTDPRAQADAALAMHERYRTAAVLSAMDLSVESEAFGCSVQLSDTEVPTITGRLITNRDQAEALAVPEPGHRRTAVQIEVVRQLRARSGNSLVLAGCIGPFSLAARLTGVSEAMELTISDPDLLHILLEKAAAFLTDYLRELRSAGAHGVIMAEPAAGLLSPRSLATFSSQYIKRLVDTLDDSRFAVILHNCAAKLVHMDALMESGLTAFHFGAPMDLPAALSRVPPDVVLCGNLDPSAVFCQSTPTEIIARTVQLLEATRAHRNFVISSGCDLPAATPIPALDAFFEAARAR